MLASKKSGKIQGSAIEYVGGTSAFFTPTTAQNSTTISLTSLTGGIASAPSLGDLLVISTYLGGTNDYLLYGNGKTVARGYANGSSKDAVMSVFTKRVLTSEDLTAVRFITADTSTNREYQAVVHVFRGATSYFVPSSVVTTANSTTSVIPDPPAITPTIQGSVIHVSGGGGHNSVGTFTYSASYLSNFITVSGTDLTHDTTSGAGWISWTSGSYNPAAWTFSGTDNSGYANYSVSIAIAPKVVYTSPLCIGAETAISGASSSTLTINKPSETTQNDLLVAICVTTSTTRTWTNDGSWTEAFDTGGVSVHYKTAGASEGSSYSFTCSSASQQSGIIMAFRGAAWDTIGTSATGTSITIPAITLSSSNSTVIAFARGGANGSYTGEVTDDSFTYVHKDVASSNTWPYVVAIKEGVASGSTGTVSAGTFSSSSARGFLIGIKPV